MKQLSVWLANRVSLYLPLPSRAGESTDMSYSQNSRVPLSQSLACSAFSSMKGYQQCLHLNTGCLHVPRACPQTQNPLEKLIEAQLSTCDATVKWGLIFRHPSQVYLCLASQDNLCTSQAALPLLESLPALLGPTGPCVPLLPASTSEPKRRSTCTSVSATTVDGGTWRGGRCKRLSQSQSLLAQPGKMNLNSLTPRIWLLSP